MNLFKYFLFFYSEMTHKKSEYEKLEKKAQTSEKKNEFQK